MALLNETMASAEERDLAARLSESDAKFRLLADTMPQMVWSTRPDGFHDYYNARWYEFTGMPAGSTDGEGWNDMFHPEDQERAWARWRHSLETGEPYEIEYRLRHASGDYRWTLGRALPMRDAEGRIIRWFGTCTDIHDQKLLMEQREIVAHELSHRIKNIFAVVSGLITLTEREHPELRPATAELRERISALGRAHDFVRPHSQASAHGLRPDRLLDLLGILADPYRDRHGPRIRVEGEDVAVDDRAATPVGLLFHELATNAQKYGALSLPEGRVDVRVATDGELCRIEWIESGGPRLDGPPDAVGFGTRLVELSVLNQLNGRISRDWTPEGLRLSAEIPLRSLHR